MDKCIHTDLHSKTHCVEVLHPPAPEESENIADSRILGEKISTNYTSLLLKFWICVPVGGL